MRRVIKEKLAELGITTESYYVEAWPSVWGLEVRQNGLPIAFIEQEAGNLRKFHVRGTQTTFATRRRATPHGTYKTQREALAAVIKFNARF